MMRWPALQAIQFPLNLLDRRIVESGVLARLAARGTTTFARSVLLQGLLALSEADVPPAMRHASATLARLRAVLARHGLHPTDAALAFVHSLPVDSVVVGVETPEQLRANVAAVATRIPQGLSNELGMALGAIDESILNPARWPRIDPVPAVGALDEATRAE
jgi:aryl-alcohol dehydrogenase-like predicted oxidoreductase